MAVSDIPFSSFTGAAGVKTALQLQLISQDLQGTLLIGRSGTGKSTLARSFAAFSGRGVVCLPQNATSESVFGSIDIEKSIRSGTVIGKKGLLSEASGKILLIDDIHLADSGMLSQIFSSADAGQVIIERDGISITYPVRLSIVATLNPDDGTFPTHLVDHFDLSGYCLNLEDPDERMKMLRVILTNERRGPDQDHLLVDDTILKCSVDKAAERYPFTFIPEGLMDLIAQIPGEMGIRGHRGELALARAARAHAALQGRDQVILDDITITAPFTLQHRRCDKNTPPAPQPPSPERENQSKDEPDQEKNNPGSSAPDSSSPAKAESPDEDHDGEMNRNPSSPLPPDQVFPVEKIPDGMIVLPPPVMGSRRAEQHGGRRRTIRTTGERGRYIRPSLPDGKARDIAFEATIRAAAPYQAVRSRGPNAITILPPDIRNKVRERKSGRTILFVVDSSGSMGAGKRMTAVKGAIFSLLQDAYINREQVSLICFRGKKAELILPPTRSGALAYKKLQDLPTGGQTPLASAVDCTLNLLKQITMRGSASRPLVLFLSDGRANVPLYGRDPIRDALDLASVARTKPVDYLVIDTESGYPRLGLAKNLAESMGGSYIHLSSVETGSLTAITRIAAAL